MIRKYDADLDNDMPERVDRAMHRAFWTAVEEHRRGGVPLAVMRNGKVVQMTAEEITAEYAAKGVFPSTNGQTK